MSNYQNLSKYEIFCGIIFKEEGVHQFGARYITGGNPVW